MDITRIQNKYQSLEAAGFEPEFRWWMSVLCHHHPSEGGAGEREVFGIVHDGAVGSVGLPPVSFSLYPRYETPAQKDVGTSQPAKNHTS